MAVSTGSTSALRPMMWMFIAILVTFLVTRAVTRLIRSGAGAGLGLKNISVADNHIHHQVFGILIMIATGVFLVAAQPVNTGLDVAAAVFGVGVSLTLDEFALWLHLEDVYWSDQGRKSIDAIFCALAVTGVLIGGADLLSGRVGSSEWWTSVGLLAVSVAFSVVCLLKGKMVFGIVGIVFNPLSIVGAIRLAKPDSWWARRFYAQRPKRMARSRSRYGEKYQARWNRLRDLVAGAPSDPERAGEQKTAVHPPA
ncbi:MAG: hypothetical protein JO147_14430 [Actinobacteria bacterium]|nr:hypothetical protein [Actinomycetota bacterium]